MANYNILLADDDEDDCMFFKDVLDELSIEVILNVVVNGVALMHYLENNLLNLPNVLFLDLNIPRKSGIECLLEIKQHEKLKHLPVIIYSTSANPEIIDLLYTKGAQYYICKPAGFSDLKSVINKALQLSHPINTLPLTKEDFVLQP